MKNMYLVGLSAALFLSMSAVACGGESDDPTSNTDQSLQKDKGSSNPNLDPPAPNPNPGPAPGPLCKPLKGPGGGPGIGLANPASVYCAELGYVAADSTCTFPDNTSCEQWAFYRGECGADHSFCATQGGKLEVKTEDMGGWTATNAYCTLPSTGKTCKQQDFASTCVCE